MNSSGPKEPCVRWGPDCPTGSCTLGVVILGRAYARGRYNRRDSQGAARGDAAAQLFT